MAKVSPTRSSCSTKLSSFVGAGKEFLQSEVPTLRSVICRGIFIQEENLHNNITRCNYPVQKIASELASLVLNQWKRANARFSPPVIVNKDTLTRKIKNKWNDVLLVARNRAAKTLRVKILDELDKLFDIVKCSCTIMLCSEFECSGCFVGAHISCTCELEEKIPKLDLVWLYHQRLKVGDVSVFQIAGVDVRETQRQWKGMKRKIDRMCEGVAPKKTLLEEPDNVGNTEISSDEVSGEISNESVYSQDLPSRHIGFKILNTAAASIRFGVSQRATAGLISGVLQDLVEGGHLSKDMIDYLTCDSSKVFRAKADLMKSAKIAEEVRISEEGLEGIFFDGKRDKTKIMARNEETGKFHPSVITEDHYTLTQEPQGKYLHHFTPDGTTSDKIAEGVYEWVEQHGAKESLIVIGGDSTNAITGVKGGALTLLEDLLGHKCHWSICMIHLNELPLRHLLKSLVGSTKSDTEFEGIIGSLISKVDDLPVNYNFRAIVGQEDLIFLPEQIIKSLSTDQYNCYLLVKAIKSGLISKDLANLKCGATCHSRWLTTGQALLMLWTRDHGLQGNELGTLELIVQFIIDSYLKLYFDIKVKNTLVDAPYHVLTAVRIFQNQPKDVQEPIKKCMIRGAFIAHPENVILSLLASEVEEDRSFAIDKILQVRDEDSSEFGNMNVRSRKTPEINFNATSLKNLIFWDKIKCYEPVFTCKLSREEIKSFKDSPMSVPYFPIHTQSTERAVQLVSDAATKVYGHEKRDGFVRGVISHRELYPVIESKKTLLFN